MSQLNRPSLPDSLSLVSFVGRTAWTALFRVITYPLRSNRAPSFGRDIFAATMRTALDNITVPQARYFMRPTTEGYYAFCKQHNINPETLTTKVGDVNEEVSAHWIGSPDAEVVVLYAHGGAFLMPCNNNHFNYCKNLVNAMNTTTNSKKLSVLILAYSLAPEATFPTQLRQLAAVLNYLLSKTGRSPGNIVLEGDSAGGGLILTLLSHLLHPHPDVPRIDLSAPLGGMALCSPWFSFRTDYDSYTRNAQLDMCTPQFIRRSGARYVGMFNADDPQHVPEAVAGDSYSEAGLNGVSWWFGLRGVVGKVFIWAGRDEVLVDSICQLAKDLGEAMVQGGGAMEDVTYLEAPNEGHIQLVMDATNGKSRSHHAVDAWYQTLLAK